MGPVPASAQAAVPDMGGLNGIRELREVRIGVLAYLGESVAADEWAPTLRHLSAALPAHRFALSMHDREGLQRAVAAREVDFVLTNPGHYVELEASFGASRIVTLSNARAASVDQVVGAAVVVASGRDDLRTLPDLRGKRVAAVGREGFGGYQLVWRELARQGIEPENDFAGELFVGYPMQRVLEAVERGEADAGIVKACLLESLPALQARFKVLSAKTVPGLDCAVSTRLYPDWPVAALRHTPSALAKAVAIALLSMPDTEAGQTWSVPADYQSVHELFRDLQIGPYAYLRAPGLLALAQRYWPVLALLLSLLAGWGLYTWRVEHLVQVRTRALRQALAEREALEQRMRANQEQAEHLSRLSILGELSGTLAHELNQPLAGIGNYAYSLIRRMDNGRLTDAAVREAAGEIAAQATRAADILARIRGFARKRVAVREWRGVTSLVDECLGLFRGMLAQAPPVTVVDRLPPGTRVKVDPLQFQQVLLNLLKNGLDAMRGDTDAEREAGLQIHIVLESVPEGVAVRVRDFGAGLDAEQTAHLFEPFYTTKPDGLGLGLSICKTIAEAHGGELTALPALPGPGMVFSLILPDHE